MIIEASTETTEALQGSAKARRDLTEAADAVNEELREHLTQHNTSQAGVITWIKRGIKSTSVQPEPLNLKEAMKYIFDRQDFESNGYDLYDFYAEDVDVQFTRIMALLRAKKTPISDYTPLTQKKLSCPPYERLKAAYFKDGLPATINYSKFVDSMAPILHTSTYMLERVIAGSLEVSQSDGKLKKHAGELFQQLFDMFIDCVCLL
jgi:hypothetical protein